LDDSRRLVVRWRKSGIGQKSAARRTLFALGLRRINQEVVHPDRPELRGMIGRVRHLVDVEERETAGSEPRAKGPARAGAKGSRRSGGAR
jgi:large subunit ribosomal protein L30